ncbi:MAG TPA: hypothetical protein PKC18_06595 [Lacipirellulaceae bacterium]|nr:hypothetical protein [Lacipirellulaceae bacterium]
MTPAAPARRQWLEGLLAAALGLLAVQIYWARRPAAAPGAEMVLRAEQGSADLSLRNADFPRTFLRTVHVDLTSPRHEVTLVWAGPAAAEQETGPFRSSPGQGRDGVDCDDVLQSNRGGSCCTPKGRRVVEGFGDFLPSIPSCRFVTWIHSSREVALHSHSDVPPWPASSGCVRLPEHAAQLIHNNAIAGRTEVIVAGRWTARPAAATFEEFPAEHAPVALRR